MSNINEILKLTNAHQPIIWCDSYEERRVIKDVITSDLIGLEEKENAKGVKTQCIRKDRMVFVWSSTQGLVQLKDDQWDSIDEIEPDSKTLSPVAALEKIKQTDIDYNEYDRMVVILRDLHQMMTNPMAGRKIRDLIRHFARYKKTIIALGPSDKIPLELQKDAYLIRYDLPDPSVIRSLITDCVFHMSKRKGCKADPDDKDYILKTVDGKTQRFRVNYSEDEITHIVRGAQGLTKMEILCAISKSINSNDDGEILYDDIAAEKKCIIKKSEVLEFHTNVEPMEDVGGNDIIKKWLTERAHAITGNAVEFGVRSPKGVLITGVQGCGKSMLAKATANQLGIPLIRLDMGRVFAGLVGSSEKNMRDAISQAEAMSPCVVGNTKITLASGGEVTAEALFKRTEEGDCPDLLGYDPETNKTAPMKLHKVIKRPAIDTKLLEIECEDGKIIKVTENHKFLVSKDGKNVIVEAKDLHIDDDIVSLDV